MKTYRNKTEESKFILVHDGTNVKSTSELNPKQEVATGQPYVDVYDSIEELRYYIGEYQNGKQWLKQMDDNMVEPVE